jgi:hypothetical protein
MIREILIPARLHTDMEHHPANMEHSAAPSPNGTGHELREVSVRFIVVSLFALLIGTFFACLLVIGIFQYFHSQYIPPQASQTPPALPPEPRVEDKPYLQLQNLRTLEDHVLDSYAWIDQSQGTVRIPVNRAIDMIMQKGLPYHNYLNDITAGAKTAPRQPQAAQQQSQQGNSNAK